MKKNLIIITFFLAGIQLQAQVEPNAGTWKTWFISSGKDYRLPAPSSYKTEVSQVITRQQNADAETKKQIAFWNAGAPGYRWQQMMDKLWTVDTGRYAVLANLLLGTAIYDATIAAWDTKYTYKRPRPFIADSRIKVYAVKQESPSYPCEHSVAAGVAVTIFTRFYPQLADSVNKLARQLMDSRVAAGTAFPSDVKAGFDLGVRIAEKEIEYTKDFISTAQWDGKIPDKPGLWKGRFALLPNAGQNKTIVLETASEFRPGAPPDFAKDMAELKNYKQTFRSLSNAFLWANSSWFIDNLGKKIFENNLHLNAPRAARMNAIMAVATYDGFVSCWDAKYTYWGIRPNQYDTTFKPAILVTPPFPGYPSGHALLSSVSAEIFSYFFPEDKELFRQKAKDAAESRFQAGIHFRTDNEVALDMGKKIANKILERVRNDGADEEFKIVAPKKTMAKN